MTGRARLLGAAVLAAALAAPAAAEARLIDLRASAQAGGMFGWGQSSVAPDFFARARGPGFGFELGARLLVIDLSMSFLQLLDSDGLSRDAAAGPARASRSISRSDSRSCPPARAPTSCTLASPGGLALGTGAPVRFPINNEQVADKGVVSRYPLRLRVLL